VDLSHGKVARESVSARINDILTQVRGSVRPERNG
jgi:hypothetical protein